MQQSIKMLPQRTQLFLMSPVKILCVLVFHLLLTHSCRGQSQLIGPSQPILAKVGDDVILPCHLEPAMDVVAMTLEWKRPEPNPMFVHVRRAGQDLVLTKHPSYKDRTSVSVDELKHGNISLKLSTVKPSDNGTYQCYIPKLNKVSSVDLIVASGAVSLPIMTLSGIDRDRGGVVLHCESRGWHPEPEVLWLDGEGHVLSAGPTETVRGPDGLYTVSSRVTVEERHRNNFTCRVQQKIINQIRETDFYIPDDFFKFQSSSSAVTVGFAISLTVCILIILLLVFLLWRQNRIKTKRSLDETDEGENTNRFKSNKAEYQFVAKDENLRVPLKTDEAVEMKDSKKMQQLQEEQQRREETENRVKTLKKDLKTKKNEVETKQAELHVLFHEEKQKNETELQNLKDKLKNKNEELKRIQNTSHWFRSKEHQRKEAESKTKKEVETLKEKLETCGKELNTKIKFEDKQAEIQQLQDEIQTMETDLQSLMEDLQLIDMELESIQATPVQSTSSLWPIISRQKFQGEEWRRMEAENKVVLLEKKLQMKTSKVDKLLADVKKVKEEMQKSEDKRKQLQTELENNRKELENKEQAGNTKLKQVSDKLSEARLQLNSKTEELSNLQREWKKQLSDEQQKTKETEEELKRAKEKLQEQNNSSTVPVFEVQVDQTNKCISLINMSKEKHPLEGWKIQIQINDREPLIDIFEKSCEISPLCNITWELPHYDTPSTRQLFWGRGDKLYISLCSNTGKIEHLSVHTYYQ